MMNLISIREERPDDAAAIRDLNTAAFGRPVEAGIVDALRAACPDLVSLVALDGDRVVGHILFSPATVERGPDGMVLGPLAVLPEYQRRGIGTALTERGIESLRERGCPFVIVYGHPGYYPHFGFERASARGLASHLENVPDDVFMVLVLDADAMRGVGGVTRHRVEFDEAMDEAGDHPTSESQDQ
jgi:putative acetyltransferase